MRPSYVISQLRLYGNVKKSGHVWNDLCILYVIWFERNTTHSLTKRTFLQIQNYRVHFDIYRKMILKRDILFIRIRIDQRKKRTQNKYSYTVFIFPHFSSITTGTTPVWYNMWCIYNYIYIYILQQNSNHSLAHQYG